MKDRNFMEDEEIAELYRSDPKSAKEKIVEKYTDYVFYVLRRNFPTYHHEFGDMFQNGVIGILKAMQNYSPTKGRFSTYCTPFIISECSKHIRFLQGESSEYYSRLNNTIKKAQKELENAGMEAAPEQVAELAGVSVKTAEREMRINYQFCSTGETEEAADHIPQLVDRLLCKEALAAVSPRQRKIIYLKAVEGISFRKISSSLNEKEYFVRKEYYQGIALIREKIS